MMRLVLAISFLLFCSAASADCSWFSKLIGTCEIGKEAGEVAAKGAVVASENIYSSVNFWAKLIEDYHVGTPEKRERARQLLIKVFGVKEIEGVNPFVVRFDFSGVNTTKHPFRVVVLRDFQEPKLAEDIKRANRSDFNPAALQGVSPEEKTDFANYVKDLATVRVDIEKQLGGPLMDFLVDKQVDAMLTDDDKVKCGATRAGPILRLPGINFSAAGSPAGTGPSPVTVKYNQCIQAAAKSAATKKLASAITRLVDNKVHLRGTRLSFSVPYQGERFITLLIPEQDLIAQPGVSIEWVIHQAGYPDRVLPSFEENPYEISRQTMLSPSSPVFTSDRPDFGGKYRAFTVDIR